MLRGIGDLARDTWRTLVHRGLRPASGSGLSSAVRHLISAARRGTGRETPARIPRGLVRSTVKRLVGSTLERLVPARRAAPAAAAGIHIEVRDPDPTSAHLAAWTAAIRTDAGCGEPGGAHGACAAARRLGGLRDAPCAAIELLEETVTQPGRPACVRAAAVDALRRLDTSGSRRALHRMRAVARRRAGWEGRPEDIALLALLEQAAGGSGALALTAS